MATGSDRDDYVAFAREIVETRIISDPWVEGKERFTLQPVILSANERQDFADAVVRIREDEGLYSLRENTVAVDQQTLFRSAIDMPADVTEGHYAARIFLTRAGRVVSSFETEIDVRKVGLERFLYGLSREQPFLYGLMSLAIAVAAGWGASAAFRLLRNN